MREFTDEQKLYLKMVADLLPEDPPLTPTGEGTVKDTRPELTKRELDYVMSIYKGRMKRE